MAMKTLRGNAVSIAWAFVVWGCDPAADVHGRVVDSSNRPVAGAQVSVTCPTRRHGTVTTTDGDGRFSMPHLLGCLNGDCAVVVTSPGRPGFEFLVRDHCTKTLTACGGAKRGRCSVVELEAIVPAETAR